MRHSMRRRGTTRKLGPMKPRKVRRCAHANHYRDMRGLCFVCIECGSTFSDAQIHAGLYWLPTVR